MVRCAGYVLNDSDMTARVELEADTKADMTGLSVDDIVGYPTGYKMDFMSSVFTTSGEMAFLKSDGETWNWGE